MNEERSSLGSKKKFLYLDKFEKFKEENTVWALSTNERFAKLKDRIDNLVWICIVSVVLSMVACLISVTH
jgi:hypothetical protein